MDKEILRRAKNLDALIQVTEINIKSWKDLFDAEEITCTSPTKANPIYLTNPKKDQVRDLIISEHEKKLKEYKKQFEEL